MSRTGPGDATVPGGLLADPTPQPSGPTTSPASGDAATGSDSSEPNGHPTERTVISTHRDRLDSAPDDERREEGIEPRPTQILAQGLRT